MRLTLPTATAAVLLSLLSLTLAAPLSPSPSSLDTLRNDGGYTLPPDHDPFKAQYRSLPNLRTQDALERGWVKKRYDHIPKVLQKHGYDAWILTMREYAEDTVFPALYSTTSTFSARRRTLFLFHTGTSDDGEGSAQVPESPVVFVDNTDEMWDRLNETLVALDPKKIAIDIDSGVAFADGLHTGESRALFAHLDPRFVPLLKPSRAIPVEVVASRVGGAEQLAQYRLMMENVWAMVMQGFSEEVVKVGETKAIDIEWWFRDVMRWRIGCTTWFPPSVDIIRDPSLPSPSIDPFVREGDVLHVDIGITAMGMNTDTQHLAYVLPSISSSSSFSSLFGSSSSFDTSPPPVLASLQRGLHNANKIQNLVRAEMVPGHTGDEVFFATKKRMDEEGLDGDVYSHPIGDRGHSAGAIIGMTNIQGAVPELGSNKVLENYWTSVELAGRTFVPEWNTTVRFELEEDVYWDPETKAFEWVWGQQTKLHLIRPRGESWAQQVWKTVEKAWVGVESIW